MTQESFWKVRAEKYNNLKWVKDDKYLNKIVKMCNPKNTDLVLDIGTGSGRVAKAIKPYVNHVIGMDISPEMMSYNNWGGMSKICNDILNPIFKDNTFNLITARMVFHHLSNVSKGIQICYNLLKSKGKLIIAESVPPSDEKEVIEWWSYVRHFKETRHTFSEKQLIDYFNEANLKKIKINYYYQPRGGSSTKEWLSNSKLPKEIQDKIYKLHQEAPEIVKKAYKMKITKNDIYCIHKHIIISGVKYG